MKGFGYMYLSLLILFLIKLADSTLSTMKSVFTYQGRRWLAMFAITGSQMMYLLLITRMEDGWKAFTSVAIAVMAGQVLGMNIGEKFTKERVWKMSITLPREEGIQLADKLRSRNLACRTMKSYIENPTLEVVAYAENKSQTKLIQSYLPEGAFVEILEIKKHFEV